MVVFDLEWNNGYFEKLRLNEIIQIGAVKFDPAKGRILDTFNAYIKPSIHKRYSPVVKTLPALDLCERSHLDFPHAIADFVDWCAGETEFAVWGTSDFLTMKENLRYHKLSLPFPDVFYDLQAAFSATAGASGQVALNAAIEYCRIPDVYGYHNAMNDALYTALVSELLPRSAITAAVRSSSQLSSHRKATAGLPKGKRWLGPYQSRDALLAGRGIRAAVCPQCKAKTRVGQWCWTREGNYLAKFSCPEHGAYLLHLVTAKNYAGQLWGATDVQPWTPQVKAGFLSAKEAHTFSCHPQKGQGRKRRRGYRRKKETTGSSAG